MTGEASETLKPIGHILSFEMFAWGHTIAALNLVTKIVRLQPVYITVVVPDRLFDKSVGLLDSMFIHGNAKEDALRALIRVAGVNWVDVMDFTGAQKEYCAVFKALYEQTAIQARPGSADLLPIVQRPKLAILDFLLLKTMEYIRELSAGSVQVYALQSSTCSTLLRHGPEEEGGPGWGDLSKKIEAITAKVQGQAEQMAAIDEMYRRTTGKVLRLPDLPPMYDHEHQAQKCILPGSLVAVFAQWVHRFLMDCDGVIHGTSTILEKEAIAEFARVFKFEPNKSVAPGPFAFPVVPATGNPSDPTTAEVQNFLDRALKESGPRSVVYFSLGSVFWSVEPEKIWAVIDVLLEQGIPLLFSHASPFTVIPDNVRAKLDASKNVYDATWMPQPMILAHKAVGWFVMHGGHNSYCEALSNGVPVICIPFEGDQPANAVFAADIHRVGYELYNARNGVGLGPILRKDNWAPPGTIDALRQETQEVLQKALGEDGAERRANAQTYQRKLADSWKEGGDSWKELGKLVEVLA